MVSKECVIAGKYKIDKLIGEGAFGKIFSGILYAENISRESRR